MNVLDFIASNAESTAGNPPLDILSEPLYRVIRLATSASGCTWGALLLPGETGWTQPTVLAPASVHPSGDGVISDEHEPTGGASGNAQTDGMPDEWSLRTQELGILARHFADAVEPRVIQQPTVPRPAHDSDASSTSESDNPEPLSTPLTVAGIALQSPTGSQMMSGSLPGLAASHTGDQATENSRSTIRNGTPSSPNGHEDVWGVILLLAEPSGDHPGAGATAEGATAEGATAEGATGEDAPPADRANDAAQIRQALDDAAVLANNAASRFLDAISNVRYQRFLAESDQGIYRMEMNPPVPVDASVEDQLDMLYERCYLAECNDAIAKMYGADSPEDLVGTTLRELHASDREANRKAQRTFVEQGYRLSNAVTGEYDQNGNLRWFSNTAFSIIIDGYVHRAWGVQQDITEIRETEAALDHSERLLRSTLDSYPYATAIFDADLRYLYANELASAPIESTAEDVMGKRPEEVYPERVWKPLLPLLQRCRDEETFVQRVVQVERDGEERTVVASFVPLFSARDMLEAIIASTRDVTEERRAKRNLRQSEQRLSLHVEHSPLAFVEWDVNGRVVKWNPAATQTFGYTAREARGLHIADLSPYADRQETEDIWSSIISHRRTIHQRRRRNLTKAGRVILCEWSMTPLVDYRGSVIGVAATAQDVTQEVEAREALRQERDLLRSVAETSAAGIIVADARGRVTFVNTRAETVLRTRRASITQNFLDVEFWSAHDLDGNPVELRDLPFQRVVQSGEPVFDVEMVLNHPDGDVILSINAAPLHNEHGQVSQVVMVMEDITDRMARQLRLREHNDVLSSLAKIQVELRDDWRGIVQYAAEAAHDALRTDRVSVWLMDEEDAFDCIAVVGPGADEDTGRRMHFPSHEAYIDSIRRQRSVVTTDVQSEERLNELSAYYRERDIRSTLEAPVRVGGKLVGIVSAEHTGETRTWSTELQTFAGSIADVVAQAFIESEQKKARAALRRSEQRWKTLVEHHPGGVLLSIRGKIAYVNGASTRILGADSPDELIGMPIIELIYPADQTQFLRRLNRVQDLEENTEPWEHDIIGLDGKQRTIVAQSVYVMYKGERAAQTVIRDVTERREREEQLKKAKEEAQRMNRLKSAFLANMSHEIRTPLTSIIGFADVLQDRTPDASGGDIADFIGQSSERLLRTLNSVLDLSKMESGALRLSSEPFDMAEVVRDTVCLLQQRVESSEVSLEADADAPIPVSLDAAAVQRILDNLIGNALKFTEQGTIRVSVQQTTASTADGTKTEPAGAESSETESSDVQPSDAQPSKTDNSNRSGRVILRVADTGPGIPEDFMPNLFEPFQQAPRSDSQRFEGSGLGLAITQRLVRMMDGEISVESDVGSGTTFTITLPLSFTPSPRSS
jgi:PAS domain S-box-containing protein